MPIVLADCTVLGGSGHPVAAGESVTVRFGEDTVELEHPHRGVTDKIHYAEILECAIGGPGTVTTGGGFIGGGFGVAGALEGIAISSVLNLLTTRTRVLTMIHFSTHRGEVFIHYGGLEPGALRIALSAVFTRLRHFNPSWIEERVRRLEALQAQELLSAEHTERLIKELTSPDSSGSSLLAAAPPVAPSEWIKCPHCGQLIRSGPQDVKCYLCGRGLTGRAEVS